MEPTKITAKRREPAGKGASRRLRAAGEIPVIAYGKDMQAMALTIEPSALLGALQGPYGRNAVVELAVGDEVFHALIADYQYHPVTRSLLHADFFCVSLEQPVDVMVPFKLTGRARGIVMGGVLRQIYRELPITCLPSVIPALVSHDITELDLDKSLTVAELALPPGVTVRLDPSRTVAAIMVDKHKDAEGEEGAAAAPPGKK